MKLIEEHRISRYSRNISKRDVAAEELIDCVEAVVAAANASKCELLRELKVKVKVEEESPIQVPRKRKHNWRVPRYWGILCLPLLRQDLARHDTTAFVFCIYLGLQFLPNTFVFHSVTHTI